jgi:hypothetical protein
MIKDTTVEGSLMMIRRGKEFNQEKNRHQPQIGLVDPSVPPASKPHPLAKIILEEKEEVRHPLEMV